MAQVLLRHVKKVYDKNVIAVDDANIEIRDKEFVVLVGPSGCGKSTTLRMIAGLEEITDGEIFIGENLVNHVQPKDRDIAMVFQNYALYPHMTVFENMAFGLKLRKYPKSEINERVSEAARILGIEELLDRKPKALSGGQRQRVAVGRAIVRKPQVFLFDEPLSNLDAKLRVQMRTEISKLHSTLETTMIYVTHDQVEAMTMGDRIVVMKDGKIMQIDSPMNLYNQPDNRFVASFIGSPAMNFLKGSLSEQEGHVVFDDGEQKLRIPNLSHKIASQYFGKIIELGIRPEDLHDVAPENTPAFFSGYSGTVEVVEPLGSETYLYLSAAGGTIVARLNNSVSPVVNQKRAVYFDMSRVHLFDGETGQSILRQKSEVYN